MLRKNFIYIVVFVIGILLLVNSLFTKYNNDIITRNKALQEETEKVKIYYDQIGKILIHALDIGLRGYAIIPEERFAAPLHNAIRWQDSILHHVEVPLKKLGYDMHEFYIFKDSLDSYARYCLELKQLIQAGNRNEFLNRFTSDKGGHLYWQYIECEKHMIAFMDSIDVEAENQYQAALTRNYILQIVFFLICFPTLLYTAYYTQKTFKLSELLRESEADKNKILKEQNVGLEHLVKERTAEIASQNEELASQRDILTLQNKQLHEAQITIALQNNEIQSKNEQLEIDVASRTQELQNANRELIQQNNQLEQFAFIAAHNLRAPLARILGLSNVIQISTNQADKDHAIEKLVKSTYDMDHVIKDLAVILEIKKHTSNLVEIDLHFVLTRVLKVLEKEIEDTQAKIVSDFTETDRLYSVLPYVESILYNLISNAIKYRDPNRTPVITLVTTIQDEYIRLSVTDNGLGIDLSLHGQSMFNLYKRFHLHMEGKGLGLYLVRSQLTALGGKIEVQSQPDVGTTFHVYIKRQFTEVYIHSQ
ncbi:sensor histidine kinase [Ohtaekwangia koreensis]|uniref:histidine kinase n=1 Tax=Ohtaekwangia koreensis TaxID=688867 RepID=A0A1T5MNG2_9BACT|nr:HAMP domain-containing sensor histidine kinase [Ohtaekwangia koreensis]SKC89458.1 Histidine kinase-, DNA gyrase B-, and HSP90-like ATPase [Ohtaekwangia koreensis]